MVEVTHRLKPSATAVSLCESSLHTYTHFYGIQLVIENEQDRDTQRGRVGWAWGGGGMRVKERLVFGWHRCQSVVLSTITSTGSSILCVRIGVGLQDYSAAW